MLIKSFFDPQVTVAIMEHGLLEVAPTHLDGVIKDIALCIRDRYDRIIEARRQKGGWEGWLQVELASGLLKVWGLQYDVHREQAIYGDSQRTDLWFEPVGLHQGKLPKIGVELKVESEYQTGVAKTLRTRFAADIKKCNAGPAPVHKGGVGTHLYAVGITSLKGDLQGFVDLSVQTNTIICFCPLVVDPVYEEKNIYLLWWGKKF